MSDDTPKIIVDDDWKDEARREKERAAEEEAHRAEQGGDMPEDVGFADLLNLIAMQAMVGLGAIQAPGQPPFPPNPPLAKFHIDMLAVLDEKTKGNLSQDEEKMLKGTLHELRMAFVHMTTGVPPTGEMPTQPPTDQ